MIEQLRRDIQARIDQLVSEVDKLRQALLELDGGEQRGSGRSPTPRRKHQATSRRRAPQARRASSAGPRTPGQARRRASSLDSGSARGASGRARRGSTKAAILATLAGGKPLTAGDIAKATGLGRPSVSTTLSTLAKSGDVKKASRGYELVAAPSVSK